jgi:Protein of unknown function (DUF2752)
MIAVRKSNWLLPALFAAMLLVELAAAHVLLTADSETVFFEGRPIHAACSFKQRFGVPCPACGISRSLVMTLHGDVATASVLNPGGPLAIFTMLYFAGAMLWLAVRRKLRPAADFERTTKVIQWSTAAMGITLIVAVGIHWIRVI